MPFIYDTKEKGLDKLINLSKKFDLDTIHVESYSSGKPKIEIIRKEVSKKGICNEKNLSQRFQMLMLI